MANRQIAIRGAGYGGLIAAGNLARRALRGEFEAETARARALGRRGREIYDDYRRARQPRYEGKERPMPSRSGRGYYAGWSSGAAHNRVVSRRRRRTRGRRRKLRWGTKVRRSALGLFEGKRHNEKTTASVTANATLVRHQCMDTFRTRQAPTAGATQGATATSTATFYGSQFHVRGIKLLLHMRNDQTTAPVDVRIICGWRKKAAQGKELVSGGGGLNWRTMFKDRRDRQEPVNLDQTQEYSFMRSACITTPIASGKYFHTEKDMVVRLGPAATDSSEGSSFKFIPIWWELRNKMNRFETDDVDATTGANEYNLDWYPVCIVYNINPSDAGSGATSSVTYTLVSTVYYKDPRG